MHVAPAMRVHLNASRVAVYGLPHSPHLTTTVMKKYLIPVGILLLAMACGRNKETRASRPESETPAPPPAEQVPASTADEEEKTTAENGNASGDIDYRFTSTYSAGDANLNINLDRADGSASTPGSLSTSGAGMVDRRAVSSTAAVTGTDTNHRFIRTADLAFRVKDVVHATLGIEDIVKAHGGWITNTRLHNEPRGTQSIPVSEDSLLEISRYEMMNTVTLRLPDDELDVALREIGAWVDLFDHRDITADDIKLRMTANALAERRAKAHSQRLGRAIDDRGRRLRETVSAEEALLASDEKRDQSVLNNMDLADRVAYSTVSLNIHQPTLTRTEMKVSDHAISAYAPSLGSRVLDALADGWRLVEMFMTGSIAIWPVMLLLGGFLWLMWRKRKAGRVLPPMVTPQM